MSDPQAAGDTTVDQQPGQSGDPEKDNHLGIPYSEFVEDVDKFMEREENAGNATAVLKRLDEQHTKYRFMEQNLMTKKRRLKRQIPDIETSLNVLELIKAKKEAKKETQAQFLLSDQVYMKCRVPPTDKVCLWLGANVMLEYSLEEAEQLLTKNQTTATKNLNQIDTDLDFLRDQITTTEVNMARVYNWDVKRRQNERDKKEPAGDA